MLLARSNDPAALRGEYHPIVLRRFAFPSTLDICLVSSSWSLPVLRTKDPHPANGQTRLMLGTYNYFNDNPSYALQDQLSQLTAALLNLPSPQRAPVRP